MTYAALDSNDFDRFERGLPRRRRPFPTAGVALVLTVLLGTALVDTRPTAAPDTDEAAAMPRASVPAAQALATRPLRHRASMIVAATADPALLDPGFSLGAEPLRLSQSHPLGSAFVFAAPPTRVAAAEIPQPVDAMPVPRPGDDVPLPPETSPLVENEAVPPPLPADDTAVPLPAPRPVFSAPAAPTFVPARNRLAMRPGSSAPAASATAASAPADGGNFLQKFFGMLKPTGPALGYAAPEDGLLGRLRGSPFVPSRAYDHWTAVYDISAHTVYLPDGTKLEAHSGLGDRLDDPRSVQERNRGATPPQMYDLQPREQLFHGVEALRLNPVGGGGVFGRTGLLAHTFMLGPNGDSNGCVSFRDYKAFLDAFKAGQVRRLAVVTRL